MIVNARNRHNPDNRDQDQFTKLMDILIHQKAFFENLAGKTCWSVIAGPGTGSMAKLSFGSKIERKRKLKNDKLTSEQREFEGEFGVFIKFANWAVGNCETQICCNDDSNEVDGLMLEGLNQLVGRSVVNTEFSSEKNKFTLNFENGFYLMVTKNELEPIDANYSLTHLGQTIGFDSIH